MNRNFIKNSVVIAILSSFATLTSCEPDDICLAEEAPFITVEMRYTGSTTELDEDTIFYEAYVDDSVKIGDGKVIKKSTFNLPIQITNQKEIKYIIRQGSTYRTKNTETNEYTTHTAPQDELIVNYEFDNQYDSKACGFGIFFKDAIFTLTSSNWIQDSETVNTTINNATTTNLIIYSQPRIY